MSSSYTSLILITFYMIHSINKLYSNLLLPVKVFDGPSGRQIQCTLNILCATSVNFGSPKWVSLTKQLNCRAVCSHSLVFSSSSCLLCVDTALKSRRFHFHLSTSLNLSNYYKLFLETGSWISESCPCHETEKTRSLFVNAIEWIYSEPNFSYLYAEEWRAIFLLLPLLCLLLWPFRS